MGNLHRQIRVGFVLVPLGLALQFLATILLARSLGPFLWGVFSVLQAIMLVCNNVAELGVGTAVTKLVAEARRPVGHYVASSLPPVLIVSAFIALLQAAILFICYPAALIGPAAILSGLNVLMFGSSMVLSCAVRGLGRINQWQIGFLGQKVVLVLVVAIVVYPLARRYEGSTDESGFTATSSARVIVWAMGAWTIANVCTLAYFIHCLWPKDWRGQLRWNRDDLTTMAGEALPVGGTTILNQLASNLDTFLLAPMAGQTAVGLYNAAQRLINPARTVLNGTLTTPTFPELCRCAQTEPAEFVNRAERLLLINWMAGLLMSIVAFIAAPLLPWILGKGFSESSLVLQLTVWALPPAFVALQLRFVYVAISRQRRFFALSVAYLLLKAVLLVGLILPYGLWGACIGSVAAEIIFAIIAWIDLAKTGTRIPLTRRFIVPTVGTMIMVLAAISLGSAHWISWTIAVTLTLGLAWAINRLLRGFRSGMKIQTTTRELATPPVTTDAV